MNTQNLDYLKDNLKYLGFGEKLYPELEKNIQQGSPEFSLKLQNEYNKDKMEAQLHFRRSEQSDMYFFNRYDAKIATNSDAHSQTFYLNKGYGVTLKEAYNLLSGRSINKDLTNKEGQLYNAWVQLDFKQSDEKGNFKMKQYHQNYGYDLEKVLNNHPIKELNNEQDKTRLMESLNKGNRQSVTFIDNGSEQKHYIEANPQFKSVNVYDANMQRVVNTQSREEKNGEQAVSTSKEVAKKESHKQTDNEEPDVPKAAKKRNNKHGQGI